MLYTGLAGHELCYIRVWQDGGYDIYGSGRMRAMIYTGLAG